MKTFKQYIEESWVPLAGKEKRDELDPKGGEIAFQLQYDKQTPFLHPAVRRAMRSIVNRPDRIRTSQENLPKGQIKRRKIQNTEGGEDWNSVKDTLNPEKVARAEKRRRGVQTSPTVLRVPDHLSGRNIEHLVGGNTRLTSLGNHRSATVGIITPKPNRPKK